VLFVERGEKLRHEEGVAARLLLDEARERRHLLAAAVQRVAQERAEVRGGERAERDLDDARARLPRPVQRQHERVRCGHLVVAVRTDEQEVARLGVCEQLEEEIEARRVGPLQIVEEQRQGVRSLGEHADEAPEHGEEAVLRLQRGQRRHRRLLADQELDRRDELCDEPPVHPEGRLQLRPPDRDLLLAAGQQLVHEL
jgi:hypothetical protein